MILNDSSLRGEIESDLSQLIYGVNPISNLVTFLAIAVYATFSISHIFYDRRKDKR